MEDGNSVKGADGKKKVFPGRLFTFRRNQSTPSRYIPHDKLVSDMSWKAEKSMACLHNRSAADGNQTEKSSSTHFVSLNLK